MTPLHWAVQEEQKECVKLLLQYGASIDLLSKFDKTPISMAIEQERADLAQMMHLAQKLIAERLQNMELQQATLMATQSLTDQLGES
ncbi:ankyrin repeat domain-containing protein, partial [Klebsiella pneumoniae]|nr:ankyrin repeat domain-containing protein [Klebsiella pneumoniae]